MRAYVISVYNGDDEVIGLVSSKTLAVQSCEDWLNKHGIADKPIKWGDKQKHGGWASKGDNVKALYKMFFVNRIGTQSEE
jgi:hypothetical protein